MGFEEDLMDVEVSGVLLEFGTDADEDCGRAGGPSEDKSVGKRWLVFGFTTRASGSKFDAW